MNAIPAESRTSTAMISPPLTGTAKSDPVVDGLLASGLPRWMIADPAMIRLLRTGISPPRTRAGRLVDGYFRLFGFSYLGVLGIRLVSAAFVIRWWLSSARRDPALDRVRHVFLGFGAAIEDALYQAFETGRQGECCRLHSLQHHTLGRLGRPRLWRTLQLTWNLARTAAHGVNEATTDLVRRHRPEWSSSVARRLCRLAYFAAWTEQLPARVETVTCIFLDAATAGIAMSAGPNRHRLAVEYWQHGFLSTELIGPTGLKRIRALNALEGRFLAQRCPGASIEIAGPVPRLPPLGLEASPVVLLASQYDTAAFHKRNQVEGLRMLQAWATGHGLELVVRPHPREDRRFWHDGFPLLGIDTGTDPFAACLERLRPLFVCSWSSTALLDALLAGIVPVLLEDRVEHHASDIAFPLDAISVTLPGQRELLDAIATRPDDYGKLLTARQRLLDEPVADTPLRSDLLSAAGSRP